MDLLPALVKLGSEYTDAAAWAAVIRFCKGHWWIPVAFGAAYLLMVYATRKTIPAHPFAGLVDRCFAVWNLGLSLFSCWGLWQMAVAVRTALKARGLFFTVCADTPSLMAYFTESPAILALILFCFSKVPELGDTVFLILKRRPVRLLQWYHHTTVMFFCWLALATEYTPGIWFAVTNYFVHSVMYMYFFLMTFKGMQRVVKPIAPLITIIQIAQMVWGLVVNGMAIGAYLTTGNCQIQAVTVYCAIVMYASYFWLFSKLFIESRAGSKKKGGGLVRSVSRKVSEALMRELDERARDDPSKKVN